MTSEQWQQTKSLFQKAMSLPQSQWQSFLEKKCDTIEIQNKVLEMLKAHFNTEDVMNTSKINVNIISDSIENEDKYIGQQIGLYKMESQIGEGGMGNVYLAERVDDYQKKVALKIIKRGMDTEALLSRFRRERQILANLVHPNIARLLDGGSTEDGLPYLVMEYIDGLIITEYCDTHKLTISKRLQLFIKVCQAIGFAHQNLVVHRDIKPNNIIVTKEGVPKLLDFGIAKLLDEDAQKSQDLTVVGTNVLTPEYASPEQIKGNPITTASDIYSLGILLYTLLTGQRPYYFNSRSSTDVENVITTKSPTLPSVAYKKNDNTSNSENHKQNLSIKEICQKRGVTSDKLQRQLNGDLDNIVLKALQKEPDRRYSTINQFSQDIRRHLNGLPVSARKDTISYRATKFIKRHWVGLSAAVITFLILIIAVIGIVWQGQIAKDEAVKSKQTLEFVKQMLAAANPMESGKELTVEQLLDEATKRIPNELQKQPQVESEIRSILGEAYQNLGHFDKAYIHFQLNLSLLQNEYGERHSLVANGFRELGVLEHYQGELSKADSLYRKAIELYRQLGEEKSGDYAVALNDFGTLQLDYVRYDSAIVMFEKSLKIMRRTFGENHYQVGSVYNNLAYAFDDRGEYERADNLYNKAINVFKINYGDEHPEIANTLNNYAFVKLNIGDTLGSLNLHQQALDMWCKLLGNDHPNIGLTLHNIAAVTYYQKKYQSAEIKMSEVIKVFSKHYPEDHPYLASSYFMMGRILNAQKKYSTAYGYLQKSLRIRKAKLEPGNIAIAGVLYELGNCFVGTNRWNDAETSLLKAHKIFLKAGEIENSGFLKTKALLVLLYEKQGKVNLAKQYENKISIRN